MLSRRVPLLLVSRDNGLGVTDRVAAMLAARLGWDAATTQQLADEYRREVALARRWRADHA